MDDSGTTWRLGRRPALDGLRGVAVLLVMAAHFGIHNLNSTSAGSVGVTVFFTLSGFLITALLLQERESAGRIGFGAFYLRRARRLLPALFCCLALTLILEIGTFGRITDPLLFLGGLTYSANWIMAAGQSGDPAFLGHLWSLAIEEQFYFVWPVVVLALVRLKRSRVYVVLGVAALASVVLRVALWDGGLGKTRIWMGTDTRADALLIGCLLAFALHGRTVAPASRWWTLSGAVALAAVLPWALTPSPGATAVTTPLLAALATAAIMYPNVTGSDSPMLCSRLMVWAGSRSYGLYLYHVPIVTAVHVWLGEGMMVAWLVALPLTLATAEASWRRVEQPFLRRRSDGADAAEGRDGASELSGDVVEDIEGGWRGRRVVVREGF